MAQKNQSQAEILSGSPQPNFTGYAKSPIISRRNPTVVDTGYALGQIWVNRLNGEIFSLGSNSGSAASWIPLGGGTDTYPITPYVVGPSGSAGFQTIQSAVNAANAAGGGMVFIQTGTYTENLTLYTNIQLFGDSEQGTFIIGTHTPPTSGTLNLNRLNLESTTDIFSSSAAGTANIFLEDSTINVTNGYTFNLPNWTGQIQAFNIGNFGTNDGFVNNTGGASVFVFSAGVGNGTSNVMTLSGLCLFGSALQVGCPVNLVTGANFTSLASSYTGTVTISNNATAAFYGDSFITGATPAITQSSSAAVSVSGAVINSSNNPAISGSGAGTITLGGLTFLSNSNTAGTLTLAWGPTKTGDLTTTGSISLSTAGNKLSIATGSNASIGTSSAMVAGTTTVNTTAVTANSKIFLTPATAGGTQGVLSVGTITAGTNFVINSSSNTDTSTVNWWIIN